MMEYKSNSTGFSLVELLVVLAIFGVIASFAIPQYLIYVETAEATACLVERGQTNRMIIAWISDHQDTAFTSLSQLAGGGYVEGVPNCPHGGEWVLVPEEQNFGTPIVGCSLHFWPEGETGTDEGSGTEAGNSGKPLTSLGSTFNEITSAMIDLVRKFHEEKGRYPRSWGDLAFSDIGLDPEEWGDAVEGVIYTPRGRRINVSPAEGFTFHVTGADGRPLELPASYNWNLLYNMDDGNWYYRNINKKNLVDISTLSVVAD